VAASAVQSFRYALSRDLQELALVVFFFACDAAEIASGIVARKNLHGL
jgi:hypothetical protein